MFWKMLPSIKLSVSASFELVNSATKEGFGRWVAGLVVGWRVW